MCFFGALGWVRVGVWHCHRHPLIPYLRRNFAHPRPAHLHVASYENPFLYKGGDQAHLFFVLHSALTSFTITAVFYWVLSSLRIQYPTFLVIFAVDESIFE